MLTVEISDNAVSRLQAIATPLVDTWDTVITRLIDHWEATKSELPKPVKPGEPVGTQGDGITMVFDPEAPPQLNFTTCVEIAVDGQKLGKAETYWNTLMNTMVLRLHAKGYSAESIYEMLSVNARIGRKEDSGYKYLKDAGISVQGQDSNAAFRQAYQLAKMHAIPFQVRFRWQDNEKAAYPNRYGIFSL